LPWRFAAPSGELLGGYRVQGNVREQEYRANAKQCLRLAERARDEAVRAYLLDMANSWLKLAQQAEKNRAADLT